MIATALTVLVSALPFVHQAYEDHSAHAAIETGAALVAWMASYLVFLRYRRSGLLNDLLLASALALLAATNLFFLAIPAAFASGSAEEAAMWAAVVGGALGAVTLAGAAFATPRPLKKPTAAAGLAGFVLALTLVLVSVIVFAFEDRLALGIDPATAPDGSTWAQPTGNLPLLALQACTGLAFALGAVGFSRRAASTGDQLISWVAIACVLGAAARENYVLFPSLYTDWVYSGDILRTAAYVCLAIGAVREVNDYHRSLAKVAVLEERRRLARDFHDGLAQELAYVVAYGRNLARTTPEPAVGRLVAAAERALDEARGAIGAFDVRVIVLIRYLAVSFHQVTVSSLLSGHRLYARPGVVSAHIYGHAVDVSALSGLPIGGNQGIGSVTETAVERILRLPAELQPRQVISLLGFGGPSFALADHFDHIHIGF